jgi:mannose-6-phosphate isomerase-like protein (cupin superfamily)
VPQANRFPSNCAVALLLGACCAVAAERTVAPTFLHRYLPGVQEKAADVTTSTCHYKPVFGVGDSETRIVRGVARYGEITVDPGGVCAPVDYPREEQVYVVLEGSGVVQHGDGQHPVRKHDFMYLPPGVKHGVSNPGGVPVRLIVMGFKIPPEAKVTLPRELMLANIDDVPLQVVGNHPPSCRFRLLMGTTESKRDRIAAAHVLTSLVVMEFAPGGTNFPHNHEREEEIYLLLSGTGDMVAGGGMDGLEGRHPARPGDAYFFRLNCTVGFYASTQPGSETARILAVRSLFPERRR